MTMKKPVYSIILPVRNEARSLPQLIREIKSAMRGTSYEIIAVDDGSTDGTKGTFKISHQGKWAAIRAGLARSKGNVIITMDADLQDDPKEVPKLINKLDEGYDLVSGWRKNRQDPVYKIVLSRLANAIYHFHDFASSMKVYRREILEELPREGSFIRYSYLFAHNLGLTITEVPVAHRPRIYGTSKFGIVKYVRILYDLLLIVLLFSGSGRIRRDFTFRKTHL